MIIIGAYGFRGVIYTAKKNIRQAQAAKRELREIPFLAKKYDERIAHNKQVIADMIQMAKDRGINLDI